MTFETVENGLRDMPSTHPKALMQGGTHAGHSRYSMCFGCSCTQQLAAARNRWTCDVQKKNTQTSDNTGRQKTVLMTPSHRRAARGARTKAEVAIMPVISQLPESIVARQYTNMHWQSSAHVDPGCTMWWQQGRVHLPCKRQH